MNDKKNILVGITGGIAAYKTLSLIRLFVKNKYQVKVVATQNALQFVTPLSIETLSKQKLHVDMFQLPEERNVEHISLAQWADAMVIAPASANCIGKLASGIADDMLSTVFLAMKKPVFLAPAMNEDMYSHFSVQKNLHYLIANGIHVIDSECGFLACNTEGKGRMAEPETIYSVLTSHFLSLEANHNLTALVTAGPTFEPIDPVRFIGNYSSGKMGYAIASALAEKGIAVKLVSGKTHLNIQHPLIEKIEVGSAKEMLNACESVAEKANILIMSAAVADYTPAVVCDKKMKKEKSSWNIELKPTVDILQTLGKKKKQNQIVVGFALETENEIENAKRKLHTKNLDFIVLNSLNDTGAGFDVETNKVTLIHSNEKMEELPLLSKKEVAEKIVERVLNLI